MEAGMSVEFLHAAVRAASPPGLTSPAGITVHDALEGNLTAPMGLPAIDGLGSVGTGERTATERADVASIPQRTAFRSNLRVDYCPVNGTGSARDQTRSCNVSTRTAASNEQSN